MALFSILTLILGLLLSYSGLVTSNTEEPPNIDEDDILSGGGDMNDEDLWNLLKQISRNISDEDPFGGFTDYEDFTLVDELYGSDVTEPNLVDVTEAEKTISPVPEEFESTIQATHFTTRSRDITTEFAPSNRIYDSTVSNDLFTETENKSTINGVSETNAGKSKSNSEPTSNLSFSTLTPPVNASINSIFGSMITAPISISTSPPVDLSKPEISLQPEVTTLKETVTSESRVTKRLSEVRDDFATTSFHAHSANISEMANLPSTPFKRTEEKTVFSEPTSVDISSPLTLPITMSTTIRTYGSEVSNEHSTTSTLSSINVSEKLTTVTSTSSKVTDKNKDISGYTTIQMSLTDSTPNPTLSVNISSTKVFTKSIVTKPFSEVSDEYSTRPSTVSSKMLSEEFTTVPFISLKVTPEENKISKSTVVPISITDKTPSLTSAITMPSTILKVDSESTVTRPLIEVSDQYSTSPSTEQGKLTTIPSTPSKVTPEKKETSKSTIEPISITDKTPSLTSAITMSSTILKVDSESTVTRPLIEVSDQYSTLPSTEQGKLTTIPSTPPKVTSEKKVINKSTILPISITDTTLSSPTLPFSISSSKVDRESTVTKPFSEVTTPSTTISSTIVLENLTTIPSKVTPEKKEIIKSTIIPITIADNIPSSLNTVSSTKLDSETAVTEPLSETSDHYSTTPSTEQKKLTTIPSISLKVTPEKKETSKSTIVPISIASTSPLTFTISSTILKANNKSIVTKPLRGVIDKYSTTPSTVSSTIVWEKLTTIPSTPSKVTPEKKETSKSTIVPFSNADTKLFSSTLPLTISSTMLDNENSVTEPFSEVSDQYSTTPSTISSTIVPKKLTTVPFAPSKVTPEKKETRKSTIVHSSIPDRTPSSPTLPVTVSSRKVTVASESMVTKPFIEVNEYSTALTTAHSRNVSEKLTTSLFTNRKTIQEEGFSITKPTIISTEFAITSGKPSPSTEGIVAISKSSITIAKNKKFSVTKPSSTFTTVPVNSRRVETNGTTRKKAKLYTQASHTKVSVTGPCNSFDKVTTDQVSTTGSTSADFRTLVTTHRSKTTSSKFENKFFPKKKMSLDPSKKVFISIEDPIIPEINLGVDSPTTFAPQVKEISRTLLRKPQFYPKVTTTVLPQRKITLDPGRKVYLTPGNSRLDPEQMVKKYNKISNFNDNISLTTLQPYGIYKNSSIKSNFDGSRIFMIDETTMAQKKLNFPPVPCCKKYYLDKKYQNEPKDHNVPHFQIHYHNADGADIKSEIKGGVTDFQQIKVFFSAEKSDKKPFKNESSKNKLSFDPNRLHILDTYTPMSPIPPSTSIPTVKNKSALDKSRKFMIDSDGSITDKKLESNNYNALPFNKKTMTQPVIQIIQNSNSNNHKNLDQIKLPSSKSGNEKNHKIITSVQKPQQSIPELFCFEINKNDRKPILSCIPLNSTIRANFMHFFKNIDTYGKQRKAPFLRKVIIKNQNPVATSVIYKKWPPVNKMEYSFSGQVSNSGIDSRRVPSSVKVSFNTPDKQVLLTNNQMQDIVRHSIIPIQHIASKQNLLFLEQPLIFKSDQRMHSSSGQSSISIRSKRSITNKCNYDGVYEDEGSSLAFVFDNTGSMRPELEQMRETAKTITKELTEKKKNLIRDYILVTFNDPVVADPFCTSNYDEFINELNGIQVHGGHDCPELALTGLKSTLEVTRPKSFIFVITDADAKDYYEEEHIQLLIMRKSPFIFFLMTERCYGWKHQRGFDVYFKISNQTNGQIIMLDKSDVKQNSLLTKILDSLTEDFLQQGLVPLKRISSNKPALIPYSVPVPLDPGIKKVTFVVSGPQPKLEITDPKGDKPPGEPKEFPRFKSVTYREPIPGVWKAGVGSSSGHSFSSYGVSNVQLKVGFSVIPTRNPSETSHRPLKSADNYILIEASNSDLVRNITHVDLVDLNENFLGTILLKPDETTNTLHFGGPFIPPDTSFNLEIHGFASDGSPLKRISPNAILPQLPELPYLTLPREKIVEEGTTYIIKCHVESLVPTTVKMYKKNNPEVQQVQNMKQTGDVYFELRDISVKDEGIYVCSASNVAGDKLKEIEVNVKAKPPVVSVKDEVFFTVGNKVLIPCIINSIHPYTLNWKKGTSSRWGKIYDSSNIQSSEKGLVIVNPKPDDEGWYQCTASNAGGESSGTTFLKLSLPPSIEVSGLRRFYGHFNFTITCSAIKGIPSPRLEWKKNGIDFKGESGRVFVTNMEKYSRIDIVDAHMEDEGNYECLASNFAGQDRKILELAYEEKPKATAIMKTCDTAYGGNCTLKCNISGRPLPNITWKKNGIVIRPFSSPNIQVLGDNSLLVYNADLSDSGVYSCVAQSSNGFSEDSITVSVTGVYPKIVEAPVDTQIEIGENSRLSCVALGTPKPKIIWRKENELLNTNHWDENILEINNASLSDAGVYTCIAENILGQAKSEAVVTIAGGVVPILNKDKDLEVRKVLIGDKVELQCLTLGGKPLPKKEWYKNGILLSGQPTSGIKLENGSYFISSVGILDIGLYECIAKNEIGSDIKKIDLKFYEPPNIDLNISSNVVATVGKPAKLICKVSGDPPPKVTWKRHIFSFNKTMRGIYSSDMNALVFDSVLEEDSGRYICQAENIAGVARRTFGLSVMVPPKIIPWPIETFVEVGNIVTLECRVRAIPRPFLQLLRNNVTIPRTKSYGQFVRFLAEPSDSGTYSCIAENRAGKDKVETNLIVLVPPQIKDTGHTVIKAISGKEALLPCDVFGNPQPSITWHFNGELIKKQIGSVPATLHLLNVTEADAGTYICVAQNKAGENKKKIELVVLTPPRIVPWKYPMKVILGDVVNITCQTFANPEPRITWLKDKEILPFKFYKDKKTIGFIVQSESRGIYTCEARNEAGMDSKDFPLVILDPPSFAKHLPFSVDVLKGSNIEIPCIAFGDPKPLLGWNRNEIILTDSNRRIIDSESGKLTILNAAPEDDGYYNCTAENRAGLVWRTVEVNVLELPTASLSVSSRMLKEGDEVEFSCEVTGKPRPKIYWKKDDRILSSDNNSKLRLTVLYKDRGNYTCVVKNSAGESFSTVPIDVSVHPKIYNEKDERITVLKGTSVTMNCSADGIPEPDILWFFNETKLGESNAFSLRDRGQIFVLSNVAEENTGLYTCVVKNFAGWVDKKFSLQVHVKPKIIDKFDDQIIIQKGKDLSIPCNAEGIPEPRISWKKGDKDVMHNNYSDASVAVHDNILLLLNSDNSSEGLYRCIASNIEGEDTKDYFITIRDNKQHVKEGAKEIEIVEGENGILKCDARPGSKIIWLKDNKTLANMPLERADDVHFVIGDKGRILKITEAFSDDSGIFSCIAIHPDGNSTTHFSLNVKFPPYFIEAFPTLDYTVRENESIELQCAANGSPPPQINWRFSENNLPITVHTLPQVKIYGENDNTLLIKSAKLIHSALYLCSASNELGTENRIFNIKVISPPQRLGSEVSEVEIVSGSKLELNCSIEGSPRPNFKWSYKSEYGEEQTLRFVTKSIYIGNALVENEGLYTCFAFNIAGNSTKSFNVSVIDRPRIKRDINNTIVVAEGDDLKLACKCQGRKHAVVQWFFNGVHLNESNNITQNFFKDFNSTQYICKLNNVSKEYEGSYTCLISNLAGADEQKYEVKVIAAPKMLNDDWRKIRKLEFLSGNSIEIECPVESTDEFRIQWKKNGVIIDNCENKTLHIPSCTIEDGGEYICIASNIAGQLASKAVVNVLAPPKLLNHYINTTLKILFEEKLLLNCSVIGNPIPTILWTRNMKQVDNITFPQIVLSQNNQILEIDEVDISDIGKYSCYSSNIIGFVENHFNVEVIVPPMVKGEIKSMEKIMNTDLYRRVVLRCPLIAVPEPNITWYKGCEEINAGISSLLISQDKKMLIMNYPMESDAGMYKCVASNNIGNETFTFFLHVSIIMDWGQWSEWSECSSSCGGGVQVRTRECLGKENETTNEYVHFKNSSCSGPHSEDRPCNFYTCPINGNWSEWGEWSDCSSSCGVGFKRRTRRCNNPPPSNGGNDCVGDTYEDKKCEIVPCPINGNWGEWSDWNECSATCGYSIKMRTRRCNNPAPDFGGLLCSGNSRDITLCKKPKCEENNIGWSSWSGWSPCSVTCGIGRQIRKRFCLGGDYSMTCKGGSRQIKWCHKDPCLKRRVPRSVELNIYGELNGLPVEETMLAEIEENSDETKIIATSLNSTVNTMTNSSDYMDYNITSIPFIISPVSWLAAHEVGGKNGFSLLNGSFHENTTYKFSTGEEMEMQSDAEIDDSTDPLKLYIEVKGNAPIDNKATIIIDPYDEDIVQTNRKTIKSSSHTTLQTNGKTIPVSWKKNIEIPGNSHRRIFPIERLKSNRQHSKYNRKKGRIEYQTGAVVTSSFENGSCPKGFKYDEENGECQDVNECVRKWQNNCYQSEICINTIGSYICECRQGYRERPDKGGCKDINECLEGSHLCSHTCQNTKGSYQCLCPFNMILSEDFLNCVEVSEEDYNIDYPDYMSSFASVPKKISNKNLVKSLKKEKYDIITCKTGFKAVKNECEDINECIEDEYACSKQELCMNTPGSYVCIDAPCPDKFIFSPETRSCLLYCLGNEIDCTDGALISESLQIITIPVYKANYTFDPFTEILVLFSYDDNNLPIENSVYEIVQNESGLPVKIKSEERLGVLYASNYFEVENKERLILMSSTYDSNGDKLHSTMFLILIYNTKSVSL